MVLEDKGAKEKRLALLLFRRCLSEQGFDMPSFPQLTWRYLGRQKAGCAQDNGGLASASCLGHGARTGSKERAAWKGSNTGRLRGRKT